MESFWQLRFCQWRFWQLRFRQWLNSFRQHQVAILLGTLILRFIPLSTLPVGGLRIIYIDKL